MPGTWLTGWDNLHPEWDPGFDLWRSLNAVWQEYQGVGLLGGMAHASDLVRQVLVWLLTVILPESLVRYTLLFGQLLLGSIGAFRLFEELFCDKRDTLASKLSSVAAALFYLLNLGTVQNFYVAFEPFYWFYGMLPWLLFYLLRAWRGTNQRGWLAFTLVSFLATPLAYIQTNFVVYGVLLVILAVAYLAGRQPDLSLPTKLKRVFLAAAITIGTNLFWLAPMAYFVLSGGSATTIKAQVNQLSTRQVTVQNQAYESLDNILTLRGYWFASQDYDTTDDEAAPIAFMQTWMSESASGALAYLFALLMILGAGYVLVYRRDYRAWGIVMGLLGMIGLLLINHLNIPLVAQIFRSPFTKVIVPLSLMYSLLLGASFLFWARVLHDKFLLLTFGFFLVTLGMYSVPSFGGHFIYHNLRPHVPEDYAALFAFMRTQPAAARTALLPAETVYGWQHMTWGYRGIGFYWFGLHQSILDRAFDVWSFDDEEFYQELHYARLESDPELFSQVLEKYDVRYLIYDQSIHRRGRDSEAFRKEWLALIADSCPQIYKTGLIQVYDCGERSDHYVVAPKQYHESSTKQFHQFFDPLIGESPYVSGSADKSVDVPFAFLLEREPDAAKFSYSQEQPDLHRIRLAADLPGADYAQMTVPSPLEASRSSFLVSVDVFDEETYEVSIEPLLRLYVNGERQEVFPGLRFRAPAITGAENVYFDFGSDYALVSPGQASNSAVVSLGSFDQDQVWRYFAAGRARARGLNINVSLQDTIELEVPAVFWEKLRDRQTIKLSEPVRSLEAEIYSQPIYLRSYASDDAVNCDTIRRGEVDRQPDGEHGYAYQVSNYGSYCDTFFDSKLDQARHSFLLRVDNRNLTGLPPTYYFWDINHQVQSWETMLPSGTSSVTFSFPRVKTDEETAFFDVHTANRSVAGEPAHNILDQTVAYIVPTEQLTAIRLRGAHAEESIDNPLEIISVAKRGTSEYKVEVKLHESTSEGVLALTQGYHDGWQAKIDDKTLTHEKYRDWANAWRVSKDECPDSTCSVKISFRPQWLEWWGLAVSGGITGSAVVGWLVIMYKRWRGKMNAENS